MEIREIADARNQAKKIASVHKSLAAKLRKNLVDKKSFVKQITALKSVSAAMSSAPSQPTSPRSQSPVDSAYSSQSTASEEDPGDTIATWGTQVGAYCQASVAQHVDPSSSSPNQSSPLTSTVSTTIGGLSAFVCPVPNDASAIVAWQTLPSATQRSTSMSDFAASNGSGGQDSPLADRDAPLESVDPLLKYSSKYFDLASLAIKAVRQTYGSRLPVAGNFLGATANLATGAIAYGESKSGSEFVANVAMEYGKGQVSEYLAVGISDSATAYLVAQGASESIAVLLGATTGVGLVVGGGVFVGTYAKPMIESVDRSAAEWYETTDKNIYALYGVPWF